MSDTWHLPTRPNRQEERTYNDVYPLTQEEYESGEVQYNSWNVLLDCPEEEVE